MGTLFSSTKNNDEPQIIPPSQPSVSAASLNLYTNITTNDTSTGLSSAYRTGYQQILPPCQARSTTDVGPPTYSTVVRNSQLHSNANNARNQSNSAVSTVIAPAAKMVGASANSRNIHSQSNIASVIPRVIPRDDPPNTTLTTSYDSTIKKKYGYYECSCGAWWKSGHSWACETQDCKQCGEQVYPYRQKDLQPRINNVDEPKVPHKEDLCGMCRKLGRSCTLMMSASDKMSASGKTMYPNDVVIKGLPMDITETKLREQFKEYGTIVRVNILAPRPTSYSRIAFITFENREIALERFNAGGNTTLQNRRMRMH